MLSTVGDQNIKKKKEKTENKSVRLLLCHWSYMGQN